jgi:hypothetical protein
MPDKPNILNLTLPLKQDADSQAKLKQFAQQFPTAYLPKVMEVLKQSQMVHYCRFVVIGEPPRYLQVLTEYDTDFRTYTDFFANRLHDFFGLLFALVEGAPDTSLANDRETVYQFIKKYDLPNLGGKAFSAFGELTVKEIQQKFGISV